MKEIDDEPCPYSNKCEWETVNIRIDRCKTCGDEIYY